MLEIFSNKMNEINDVRLEKLNFIKNSLNDDQNINNYDR